MDNLREQNQSLKRYKTITNVLMSLAIIIYSLVTALLIYCLIDAFTKQGWAWIGFVLILVYATIGYSLSLVLALVGLIITALKRKAGVKLSRLIIFIVLTALPLISEAIFILISTTA